MMLYDIGFLIFSLFYIPALVFRGRLHAGLVERFGIYGADTEKKLSASGDRIWIQAVSVGEVALCKSLIPELRGEYPGMEIVLSTITRTGNELAKRLFSEGVTVIYFPLDFSFIARRVARLIRPRIYIMVETEIWPNLLNAVKAQGARCLLLNGRISDRSIGKYMAVRKFLKGVLLNIDVYCMQSSEDSRRIVEIGAPKERVRITGTMKFDINISDLPGGGNMRSELGLRQSDELIVGGSTHKGEEGALLSAYIALAKEFQGLRLLIAPRHIDRVCEIEALTRRIGLEPVRVSRIIKGPDAKKGRPVLILDKIGQLKDIYMAAFAVFVGGSLVNRGGQNPIEAGVLAKPVLFGPHMNNFKPVSDALLSAGGALQVHSPDDLYGKLRELLRDKEAAAMLGENAMKAISENKGATRRNLDAIASVM